MLSSALERQIREFLRQHKLHEIHVRMDATDEMPADSAYVIINDSSNKFICFQAEAQPPAQCTWWLSAMPGVKDSMEGMRTAAWSGLLGRNGVILHRNDGSGDTFPLHLPVPKPKDLEF